MKTTVEKIKSILGICLVINLFVLAMLSLSFFFADQIYAIQAHWFLASKETFVTCIYCFIGSYKLAWIFFNVVPYFALRIFLRRSENSDV